MIGYRVCYYWEYEGDFGVKYFKHRENAEAYYKELAEEYNCVTYIHARLQEIYAEDV